MRPLSVLETAIALSLGGSILAVGAPAFVRNLDASRLAEPVDGLQHIAARASELADGPLGGQYPEPAPLTPEQVPQATSVLDPPDTWAHPTWKLLQFEFTRRHRFSFQFDSTTGPKGSTFEARAHGDLDGDGLWSTFVIRGQKRAAEPAETFPLEIDREIE